MTGCSWYRSPTHIILTPPNGNQFPLASWRRKCISFNIVLPTIENSSNKIHSIPWNLFARYSDYPMKELDVQVFDLLQS